MGQRSTVAGAMLAHPTLAGVDVTVAQMRTFFTDDHVHCGLIASAGRLLAVVVRDDLGDAPDDAPALAYGSLAGRTVAASADLDDVRREMIARGIRRLAVVDEEQALLGLLCLKRTGQGFCSADDVNARAAERLPAYEVIVLAGGRGSRLGGVDKTALPVGSRSLLEHLLSGLGGVPSFVIGPEVDGGPVAGIAAGLAEATAEVVVLLAGDMPLVAGSVPGLLDALASSTAEAAVLVADDHRQYLAAAWRRSALVDRLKRLGDPIGAPVRALYDGEIVDVTDIGGWSIDVDTPEDLERLRALLS